MVPKAFEVFNCTWDIIIYNVWKWRYVLQLCLITKTLKFFKRICDFVSTNYYILKSCAKTNLNTSSRIIQSLCIMHLVKLEGNIT